MGGLAGPQRSPAVEEFDRRYRESEIRAEAASARIRQYVKALLARYPDMTDLPDELVDTTPWADGPLIDNAIGDFFYFAISPSHAEEVVPFLADTAQAHGLACFDPQEQRLLNPPPRKSWRPWRR